MDVSDVLFMSFSFCGSIYFWVAMVLAVLLSLDQNVSKSFLNDRN